MLAAGACVQSPVNGDFVSPSSVPFQGYAQHADADVIIEARNHSTGEWDEVGGATASSWGVFYGQELRYPWSATIDFTALPNGNCYLDPSGSCAPVHAYGSIDLRLSEPGSDIPFLYVFDQGGIDCVTAQVAGGQTWASAGLACSSPSYPVLTLQILS